MNNIKTLTQLFNLVNYQYDNNFIRNQLKAWNIPNDNDLLLMVAVHAILLVPTSTLRMGTSIISQEFNDPLCNALQLHVKHYTQIHQQLVSACAARDENEPLIADANESLYLKAHNLTAQVRQVVENISVREYLTLLETLSTATKDIGLGAIVMLLKKLL